MDLAGEIAAYVAQRHCATFQALAREWPEHFADGACDMTLEGENPNSVLWAGCSAEAVAAVHALFKQDRIGFRACSPALYFSDGMMKAPLPMAEHGNHTQRRWWPAQLVVIT